MIQFLLYAALISATTYLQKDTILQKAETARDWFKAPALNCGVTIGEKCGWELIDVAGESFLLAINPSCV